MAETVTSSPWTPRRAWVDWVARGQFGSAEPAGIRVQTRDALGIATLIAPADNNAALAAMLSRSFGLVLPLAPQAARSDDHQIVWSGPGQWILIGDSRAGFANALVGLADLAAASDQSDSRAVLRLSGPRVRDALAKGCMIDLHPAAFPVGAVALTSIAYMGVCLWRAADGPEGAVFEIMCARSMAGSFWSWFTASAAEFGYVVLAGQVP